MALSEADRAEIVRLYVTPLADGTWMGTPSIGRRFGIAAPNVRYHLKRAGIEPRSSREAFAGGKRTKPITNLPTGAAPVCKCGCGDVVAWNRRKNRWNVYVTGHYRVDAPYKDGEWLRQHYIAKRMTSDEIGALCGVQATTVLREMRKHGIERRSVAESRRGRRMGAANHAWRGGVTPERQRLYKTPEWKALLSACFKRDGYRCIRCEAPKTRRAALHAHHVKSWAEYPELRLDLHNVVTLCAACHAWVHSTENIRQELRGGYGRSATPTR